MRLRFGMSGLAWVITTICLLGGASASATVFNVTGTLSDGSAISGTLDINTVAGTVTSAAISLGAPDNQTCNTINFGVAGGSAGFALDLLCAPSGLSLRLTLSTPIQPVTGTLVGYTGGAINTVTTPQVFSYYGGTTDPVTAGNVAVAALPPAIVKAFGAATIQVGATTSLTFTITATTPLTNVSFSDTLPAGLAYAGGLATTCTGVAVAAIGPPAVVSLSAATFAAPGSCTITVNVRGVTVGPQANTVTVADAVAGVGNTSTATLNVVNPPTIWKAFADSELQLLGLDTTALTFTITNPASNPVSLTGIAFSDTLPAGLIVSTPSGLAPVTCGGGPITAVDGSNLISLTGATLAPGASCTFSLNVTATEIGALTNTTSPVTAIGGTIVGNAATANVNVDALFFLWFFHESGGGRP